MISLYLSDAYENIFTTHLIPGLIGNAGTARASGHVVIKMVNKEVNIHSEVTEI
jgi:hypothetical protein